MKKKSVLKRLKLTSKVTIAIITAIVVILGAASFFLKDKIGADTMSASCSEKKGKCVEEGYPVAVGPTAGFKIVIRDKATKKEYDGPYKTSSVVTAKNCYKKGAPGHPNGGCVVERNSHEFNGPNFMTRLYRLDTKYYNNGKVYKTKSIFFTGYNVSMTDKGGMVVSSMWKNAVYEVKFNNKSIGKVKVSAPFSYATNEAKAINSLNKLNGKTYYIDINTKSLLK